MVGDKLMKIFIINLERSRERKTHMQEKLALLEKNPLFQELGLSYQFFNAVDSKSEGFKEYATRNMQLCLIPYIAIFGMVES